MTRAMIAPLSRGVYWAPWVGPAGEPVLIALDGDRHLVGEPRMIARGENSVAIGDEMWELLDNADRQPDLKLV